MNDLQNENKQEELVELYIKTKDEKYLEELLNELNGMIYALAYDFNKSFIPLEIEDLVREGQLAIIASCQNFQVKDRIKFSTFAYRVVKNRFLVILKKYSAQKRYPGNYTTFESLSYDKLTYADMIGEEARIIEELEFKEMHDELIYLIFHRYKPEDAMLLLHEHYNFEREIVCRQLEMTQKQYRDKRRKKRKQISELFKK